MFMAVRDTIPKNKKLVKRGRGQGHVTYLSNFSTSLISMERLKIQTSNFACGLKVTDTKSKNEKYLRTGSRYKPQVLHAD